MNSDLVNRDAALLAIHNFQTAKGWQNGLHEMDIHKVLLKLPTVDAVEVVRCKDCRYWRQEVAPTEHWVCTQHSNDKRTFYTLPTFFCADGLRRDT